MLPIKRLRVVALAGAVLAGGCGEKSGTEPEPVRDRTAAEQLSDRPVPVKNASVAPQFYDDQLSAPASGPPMSTEAFIQSIGDPGVDANRIRSRLEDPQVKSRVPQDAMRLALAYIAELVPEVWEQFTTARTPAGQPLVKVLEFSRGAGEEWESGAVYARVQPVTGSQQLAYVINDLYAAEDPRIVGPIIAHELLTHTSAHNSRFAEAVGVGLQSHLFSRILSQNPELATANTRLAQIVSQLAIQYIMGSPATEGATPADQGIRGSNGNRPLVVTSSRLTQRSFMSLFEAMDDDAIPGSAILGRAYQNLLNASEACPTSTIDRTTTACLDEQIGVWSSSPAVQAERVKIADLFTLDLRKTTE